MVFKNFTYKLFLFFWPLVMLNYYLLMRFGYNLTIYIVDIPLGFFAFKAFNLWSKSRNNQFVSILGLYAFYVLFSVVAYAGNGTPIQCFFQTIPHYFLPICFAFIGYSLPDERNYYKFYLYACAICFIIGFYLMAAFPPYYVDYLKTVQEHGDYNREDLMEMTRFCSFLGSSYNISYLSVPALTLALAASSKRDSGIKRWVCYIIAIVSFIAAIICQQRIAIFFAISVVLLFACYSYVRGNRSQIVLYIVITAFIFYIVGDFIVNLEVFDSLKENVTGRFEKMNFSTAMSTRSGQYSSFDRATWWSYIIGLGMGSCGHLVIPYNLQAVYDGEFVKTFYEFGLVGTILLSMLIFITLVRGVKLFKYVYPEFLIMLFFLGACIGASALTYFIFNSMFWFSMGMIWNRGCLENRRKEISKNKSINDSNNNIYNGD